MAADRKDIKQPNPLPAPNSDFYELAETLPADELKVVKQVRAFMETKVAPVITKYWIEDAFPFELLPGVKELGIGGLGIKGYGCAGGSLALLGFVQMEIARVDPSFSTFMGVHDGLAMGSIYIGRRGAQPLDLYDEHEPSAIAGRPRPGKRTRAAGLQDEAFCRHRRCYSA